MENAVAITALGLAGTTIAGLIWVVKYFANTLTLDIKEHTIAAQKQTLAAEGSITASRELAKTVREVGKKAELSAQNSLEQLEFMKKLNGKLENAIVQKVAEQTVQHQTIVKE